MTFSPFDPEVMRVTLGRARAPSGGKTDIDRIAENTAFEEARLKSTYREIEKRFAELLSLEFVNSDPEAMDRLHQLFYAVDIEDFSRRFDHFADYALQRLEVIGNDDDAGAAARARLRAGLGKLGSTATATGSAALHSPMSLMNESSRKPGETETESPGEPSAPRPRMRLRL
ncbi:hypothetical protein [Rhizobium alvei]|uniref:Uncharacterized protein n=1 Tax=Rhizobium alvei TaxID=1132659 RepID=A0ABT8YS17_9HYPH|nr:hypothetical protein [Rhizobium alvei]MDO6966446.1 hypothetical protein [Rhizobium alvei]